MSGEGGKPYDPVPQTRPTRRSPHGRRSHRWICFSALTASARRAHGARMDVFCATMLGKTEIVKAFLADDPKVVALKGPHGIPLVRHAQAGKQDSLVEMLVAAGAKI